MKYITWLKINHCFGFSDWVFWYHKCNTGYKFLRILGFQWEGK